jgi:Flp pilus assembly protein TadD
METESSLNAVLAQVRGLSREGRTRERERVLREALGHFPDSAEVPLQLAAVYLEDRHEEARRLLSVAVDLAPDDPAVLTRVGSMLLVLDDVETARNYAKRAVAAAPPDFELAADLAHLVGRLAWLKGNYGLAEEALGAAFDDDPRAVGHGRALSEFLASQGRVEEAQSIVERALEHRPSDEALLGLRDRLLAEGQR